MRRALSPPDRHALSRRALGLSIVMPCLDEARTVGRCVEKAFAYLHRHGILGEVVVAENGSTDGLQAICRRPRQVCDQWGIPTVLIRDEPPSDK